MKKFWIIVVAFLMMNASNVSAKADQKIHEAMQQYIQSNHISGMMLSVNVPGEHEIRDYFVGSALRNKELPLHAGHLMMAASNTKSFVAALVLKQVESGRMSLDQTVMDYLPEYPEWGHITLRQLLNHSSGIYNFSDSMALRKEFATHPKDEYSRAHLIEVALGQPLYFEPGHGYHYGNTNYLLLGEILERVTGRSLTELLNDTILNVPEYNLNNSYYFHHMPTADVSDREAHGYYYLKNGLSLDVTGYTMSFFDAAGGIISNSHDLVKWYQILFEGDLLTDASKSLQESVISKEDASQIGEVDATHPRGYGLGLESSYIDGRKYYWHSGGAFGYKSLTVYSPSTHLIFSIMFNRVDQGHESHSFGLEHEFPKKLLALLEV